jgi:uncharacterized protein YprB with RNaseH-like and TPR domain
VSNTPKILVLDIETKPATVLVFRLRDITVGLDQVLDPGGISCVGAKWLGEKETFFYSEWEHGHEAMLRALHTMLTECDAVISFNGNKFDLPKLRGEFALYKFDPLPQITSIDVWRAVTTLGLLSTKLAFVGPFFGIGKKIEHEGFGLWRKVHEGDTDAQKRMQKYCIQDVVLLEDVYIRLRPYILNHPNVGTGGDGCEACGSHRIQKRGFRFTKKFRIQRLQCTDCGSWHDGKKEMNK